MKNCKGFRNVRAGKTSAVDLIIIKSAHLISWILYHSYIPCSLAPVHSTVIGYWMQAADWLLNAGSWLHGYWMQAVDWLLNAGSWLHGYWMQAADWLLNAGSWLVTECRQLIGYWMRASPSFWHLMWLATSTPSKDWLLTGFHIRHHMIRQSLPVPFPQRCMAGRGWECRSSKRWHISYSTKLTTLVSLLYR